MKKSLRAILLLLTVFATSSCKRDDQVDPVDFGYDYMPLLRGSWIEYDVDSIVYDEFNARVDTFSFIQRDECVEAYKDLEGRTTFRFERFKRYSDTASMQFVTTYTRLVQGVRAELFENNVRTVPLVFPPKDGEDWDVNAFNALGSQEYSYDYVGRTDTLGGTLFDNTLRVIQQNDTDNFIIKQFAEERYTRNVGLVYKRWFDIETQFGIDSGLQWVQTIRNFSLINN